MSLTLSLNNALSGLKASQQSIAVISQNIANANNPDYSRQVSSQATVSVGNNIGNGVIIEEVSRVVDEFLSRTVITRTSDLERAKIIEDFYSEAQAFIGSPGEENSIDSFINNVFQAFNQLSASPEISALKFNAANSADVLAREISSLARNIESLRFSADQRIATTVNNVNNHLENLYDLNIGIISASSNGESQNALADEMLSTLKDLSEEIEIQYFFAADGTVSVYTANGASLLDGLRYELQYTKSSSVDSFVNDTPMAAIEIFTVLENGELDTRNSITLATSGVRDSVSTSLTSGKLSGLLELRDKILPDILDQLDQLASAVTDGMNAIHNNGVSFPPANSLTGTTLIDPTDTSTWTGNFMLTALNADGSPSISPYASLAADNLGYEPLILDLGSLYDSNGIAGTNSFQTIIDEINHHFGVPQRAVSIGDLSNIELVSKSDSLADGVGSFDFEIEVNNLTANDATYRITGVTTSDAGIVVDLPAAFPSADLSSTAGEKGLSGLNFSLDMTNSNAAGPYTISLAVEVDDGVGGTYTDTIDYVVTEAAGGLINDRYAANAISGVGDATVELPTTNAPIMTAILVDASGNEIPKDSITGNYTDSGYLKIVGNSANGADVRIGMAELTSSYQGETTLDTDGNNFGFSHYFGLNNFFVDSGRSADSAYNMSIRADLKTDPAGVSTGQLQLSPQPTSATAPPVYSYEISIGANEASIAVADFILNPSSFDAAGGLPSTNISISSYAAEILGFNAALASNAIDEARKQGLILDAFVQRDDSVRGVNVDEELANTIIFQNAYTANARVISVTRELFDDLLGAF